MTRKYTAEDVSLMRSYMETIRISIVPYNKDKLEQELRTYIIAGVEPEELRQLAQKAIDNYEKLIEKGIF